MMMEKYIAYESDKYFLEQLYKNLLVGVARLDVLYANYILFELSPCTKFVLTNWACASGWSCNPGRPAVRTFNVNPCRREGVKNLGAFHGVKTPRLLSPVKLSKEEVSAMACKFFFFHPQMKFVHFTSKSVCWYESVQVPTLTPNCCPFFTWLLAAHTIRQENRPSSSSQSSQGCFILKMWSCRSQVIEVKINSVSFTEPLYTNIACC